MATSGILSKYNTVVTPTITLNSLGNGAGRISLVVDNSTMRAPQALVSLRFKVGTSPTANSVIKIYLVRRTNAATDLADDALGTADAAVAAEPAQAELLGSIVVTAVTGTIYEKVFVAYDLSEKYSIVVWNATGVTSDATNNTTNYLLEIIPIFPEAQ